MALPSNYDEIIDQIRCCTVNRAAEMAENDINGVSNEPCFMKNVLANAKFKAVKKYIPVGTVVEPATIAYAELDLSAFVGGTVIGSIEVNGVNVGNFSGTYASAILFCIAVAAAINAGGSGYTAVASGAILIVTAPPPASAALNGLVVEVLLNPYFAKVDGFYTGVFTPSEIRGLVCINDPFSIYYGYTFVCSYNTNEIYVYDYITLVTILTLPDANSFPTAITYSPATKGVYVSCATGAHANVYKISGATFVITAINLTTPTYLDIKYNPVNTSIYVAGGVNSLKRIDATDTPSTVQGGTLGLADTLEIDTYSGDIWVIASSAGGVCAPDSCGWIIDTTNAIIGNFTVEPSSDITFYPAASQATGRMFITDATNNKVQEWGIDGVDKGRLLNANFVNNTIETPFTIYYSALFDVLLVGYGGGVIVYTTAGVIFQPTDGKIALISNRTLQLVDNDKYGVFARSIFLTAESLDNVEYFDLLGTDEEFRNPLLFGTPEVLQTAEMNCATETQQMNAIQQLLEECGCCESNEEVQTPTSENGVVTSTIYFGRSASTTLNEAGVLALGSISQIGFAGTYNYPALPSTYVYFAVPVSLGLPSAFEDSDTGFPFIMDAGSPTTVTVNGTDYYVWRGAYQTGGIINLLVIV